MGHSYVQFKSHLVAKLDVGHILVFSGKSFKSAESIYVDLYTPNQVAIRALFDFKNRMLIRCIKKDKDWINEETKKNMETGAPMIPKPGEKVKIAFFCDEDNYRIWIKDLPFCHYDYFIPNKEVIRVEFGSEGLENVYQFDHRKIFPSPWPLIQYDEDELDFSNEIAASFKPNQLVVLTGWTVGQTKGGFNLFLRDGQSGHKLLDIGVCFDKEHIVRSAMKDPCSYGHKYTDGPFPFKFGQKFKLSIGFLKDRFIFGVNGQRLPDFKYTEKHVFDYLASVKICGRDGLHVVIDSICYADFTSDDCIDYKFEDIYCRKGKQNILSRRNESGDTGDEEGNFEDDDSCIDDEDYGSSSSGSFSPQGTE